MASYIAFGKKKVEVVHIAENDFYTNAKKYQGKLVDQSNYRKKYDWIF
jgi:hypothetical protein